MKKITPTLSILALFIIAFYGVRLTGAFEGPAGTAGTGNGAIAVDSANNLSIGTSTVMGDTRLFILGANSATDKFAIQLRNLEGRSMFTLRNDGRMSVGPFPIGNPPTFTTSTLLVRGTIETVNSSNPNLVGGIKFPDGTIQSTAGGSTASAVNVSAGHFGTNTGGGNYSFPASLGVGVSSIGSNALYVKDGISRFENSIPYSNVARFVGGDDDGAYEWVGFYSGATRYGIHIWDRNWSVCDIDNTYCIAADAGKNLQLASDGGTVYVRDTLDLNSQRITSLASPIDLTDAANKSYVDSSSGVQYMGRTGSYTGNLGGIAGANAKCSASYSGSHMCTQGEALRTGATSFGGNGWVSCDLYVNDGNYNMCNGVTYSIAGSFSQSCSQWSTESSQIFGPVMSSVGSVASATTCNTSRPIHCCK